MVKTRYRVLGFGLLVAAATTACRNERAAPDDADAVSSTARVLNSAPRWRAGESWTVSPSPLLVIGGTESDSSAPLFAVSGAVRLTDGRIVVADRGAGELRIYDSRGRHLLTSGAKGSGPSEFRDVAALARIRGDTLLVWDRGAARLSVFDSTGRFIDAHRAAGVNALPWFAGAFMDGSYAASTGASPAQMMAQAGSIRQDTMVVLHLGRRGEVLDTIGRFPGPEMFVYASGGSRMVERVIFGESSSIAVGADRFVAGTNTRYELTAYTPAGNPVHTIVKRETRRSVSPGAVDAYRKSLLSRNLTNVPAEVRASAARRVAAIPHRPTLPSFGDICMDSRGYLWVSQVHVPGQAGTWDVFDSAGIWLGSLGVPANLRIHEIGEDYLLGVATDELGVERVEMYRLHRRG
jgi:hypothetical protein